MHARFEIIEATADGVSIECEALGVIITIEADGFWTEGAEAACQLERDGFDVAEWAMRVAKVGADKVFSIRLDLDERFEGLAGLINAEDVANLYRLQGALTPEDESGAKEALYDLQDACLDGHKCGWHSVLKDWLNGEYQTGEEVA